LLKGNLIINNERIFYAINSIIIHQKIVNFFTYLAFFTIFIFLIVFFNQNIFSQTKEIKIVNKYQQNSQNFNSEKTIINPRMALQDADSNIYYIKASKAISNNLENFILENVQANSQIGNITAGMLNIEDKGNVLIFSQNPVLIINQKGQSKLEI